MNKLTCVLQPDRIPGADSVRDKPPDIMHIFGAGIIRTEGALALEILFHRKSGLAGNDAWSNLNVNIANLNARLPRGKRISKLYKQRDGKKKNEQHLDLNASEAFLFIVHSRSLIEPLLTDKGRKHPCWLSLQALAAVVQKVMQHVFADQEADQLAELVAAHLEAFDAVHEYQGLERPKHHFMEHLPQALRMFGPFRGFWCMPFEAFLQVRASLSRISFPFSLNLHASFESRCCIGLRHIATLAAANRRCTWIPPPPSTPPCSSPRQHRRRRVFCLQHRCAPIAVLVSSSTPPRRVIMQLIKKIIHMSNYKSPAFQILHFWSMRSALLLVENSCIDILDDGLEYSSELHFDLSRERIAQSLLLTSVATSEVEQWQSVCATRNVRSFQRGSLEVRSNDWVVVNRNGQSCVGHVGEIIEFVATGGRFVRLLLRDARPIDPFNSMSGQVIRVSTSVAPMVHVVTVESSSFHEVYCDDGTDGELRFTYIY